MEFDFKKIEEKWQKFWDKNSSQDLNSSDKKFYCLTMFSYPSGSNLHVGHWYNYGPTDSYARFLHESTLFPKNVKQFKYSTVCIFDDYKFYIR